MDKAAEELLLTREAQLQQLADVLRQIHAFNRSAIPELQEVRETVGEEGA